MVAGRCTGNCRANHSTDFEDTAGNTACGADSPGHLAARRLGEVQALLVAVVAVVVAAVAAAVGAQVNLWRHRAAHCVHQTLPSAVGCMSHKSSGSRATDSPRASLQGRMTYPLLTVGIAIISSSAERTELRNGGLLT